jgi:hypothetical protein
MRDKKTGEEMRRHNGRKIGARQALSSLNFNQAFALIKLNAPITVVGMSQRGTVSVHFNTDMIGSNTALVAQLHISIAMASVVLR